MHSEKYLEELQTLHSKKTFGNTSALPKDVKALITKNNIKSILDFGWKIVSEDITERHDTVKKGPPRHVIKYIVYLQKV
jgi:hypothetical protein